MNSFLHNSFCLKTLWFYWALITWGALACIAGKGMSALQGLGVPLFASHSAFGGGGKEVIHIFYFGLIRKFIIKWTCYAAYSGSYVGDKKKFYFYKLKWKYANARRLRWNVSAITEYFLYRNLIRRTVLRNERGNLIFKGCQSLLLKSRLQPNFWYYYI